MVKKKDAEGAIERRERSEVAAVDCCLSDGRPNSPRGQLQQEPHDVPAMECLANDGF